MINFDNAATTYPKPLCVRRAADNAVAFYGGNAGRGGHELTVRTSRMVFNTREAIASFFDGKPENTILCLNCTHALNTAIRGVLKAGDHVIISSMEHNSVYRPVAAMVKEGLITCTIVPVSFDEEETLRNIKKAVKPETKAVVFTMASNVTGQRMPFRKIGKLCKEMGLCFIADGAQVCGVVPVSMEKDNISILCTAGHKGLYGTTGTGLLITDCSFPISPLLYGGTGSSSRSPSQPDFLPDRLESGTQNIAGAAAIGAGIEFINQKGIENIFAHEDKLCRLFINSIKDIPEITVYRNSKASYMPLVAFNVEGSSPEDAAMYLCRHGFCLRAGLHCAPLAHEHNSTPMGTLRFAPSVFNNEYEVAQLSACLKKYVRNLKSEQKLLN